MLDLHQKFTVAVAVLVLNAVIWTYGLLIGGSSSLAVATLFSILSGGYGLQILVL